MTFYDLTSTVLTVIGYTILVYRIVFELESDNRLDDKSQGKSKSRQQKLCTKWLVFTIFLKLQYTILAVMQIIPFGSLFMLVVKLLLFLPENAFSHTIYKKLERHLEKIKLEDYNSRFGVALSFVCTNLVKMLMKFIKKIAAYIDSQHIEEAEQHILEIIKILEYKKSAINMRNLVTGSIINEELNITEFRHEADQIDSPNQLKVAKSFRKSAIGEQMSKILAPLDESESEEILKVKAQLMIVKPNRETNQKAIYEPIDIEYFLKTSKISFVDKNKATENGTLAQIKWLTKDMMNLECLLKDRRSKLIKIKDKLDVFRWVEPVCANLNKLKTEQPQR